MNKLFFIKNFFLPAAFFSFVINMLLLAPTFYMMQLFTRVVPTHSEEVLWLLSAQLGVALMVMGALEMVRARILVTANNAIDAVLAPYVLKKMLLGAVSPEDNPYRFALNDLHLVRTFLTGQGIIQFFDVPWLPIYMLLLYMMNPLLFYLLVVGSLIMGGLTLANERITRASMAEASQASRSAARFVDSAMSNAEVVNAMGMQTSLTRRWAALNDRAIILQTTASNRSGGITGVTKFMRQFIQSMGMAAGAYLMLKDPSFTGGLMMAGGILFGKALGPLEYVVTGWKGLFDTRTAYARLEKFLKSVSQEEPVLMELPPPTGQLTLEHVTFGIRSTSKVLIQDVSFSLAAGEFLGVVGPSASGKSTLARLLVKVWKPLHGVIRLDGSDTNGWPAERLGRHIGYLPQDIELFAGTIAENIARMEESDPEKVIAAARMAGLHEIILHLPNGYDTQIGEGGAVLSGGQRQRIGFARALYGNPKIIVLDEPNSSLDTAGETALINALLQLKQAGKTTILITHNPNFLSHVDKLLVMQNGQAVAFGPRDLVLAQSQIVKSPAPAQAQVAA
jgi:ATP-binding cassette, subfamily C, bacterial EexD